jgi:hypothetical protein
MPIIIYKDYRISIHDILKEIRNRVSLPESALVANSDVKLPKVPEEWNA